jgi:MFS family permease
MSSAQINSRTVSDRASALCAKAFWRIVPLLMACYTVSYLNRINVGFAKLQMSVSLGFSESVFGLGAGVFFIGYFLFGLPSNLMMQRFGARRWIGCIMILWGVTSSAFVFVRTPVQFGIVGFLLGTVEAGFYPGVIVYLASWFPSRQRARILALFMSAIPLAGIFGNPLSGWIIDTFGSSAHLLGWQWMFLIEAIPAVLLGAVVMFTLDDSIGSAKWLTNADKQLLCSEIEADTARHDAPTTHLSAVIKDRRVWLMSFIYFAFIVGQYGLTFWMPTLIHGTGVRENTRIGWLSAIPFLCAVVAMNLCGRSADVNRERRWHVIIPALVGAVGFVVAASFSHNTVVSVVALSLAAAGVLTCAPLFWSLPTSFLAGTAAAAGVAIINSIGNLAGFVSPSLIGYLRDLTHSSQSGMYFLASIMVAGAIGVWVIPAKLVNR